MSTDDVNGLTTPALTDGEFMDAQSEIKKEQPKQPSAIDLAQALEAKIAALRDQVEKDDAEMERRLGALATMVEKLRETAKE